MYKDGITGNSSGGVTPTFVNHCGHGEPEYYVISDGVYFNRSHAESLNNDYYPITASLACNSGAFDGGSTSGSDNYTVDRDCLAESFLKNPNGGMTATFMNTRYGIGTSDGGQATQEP